MSGSSDSIQAQLAALRQSFADQLPQRIAAIDSAHDAWCNGGGEGELREYHRLVHSLTGAGATFGYDRISQLARHLERFLKQLLTSQHQPLSVNVAAAAQMLANVRAESQTLKQQRMAADVESVVLVTPAEERHLVYLLENEETSASEIERQLKYFGYRIQGFSSSAELQRATAQETPAIVLADIELAEGEQAGIAAVRAIQPTRSKPIPIIFFSDHAGFDVRLEAVRAGGVAYLTKPLAFERLIDEMDKLVEHETREPFRVLVVDDEPDQAQHSALVLRQSGMVAQVMTDSMKVFNILAEFSPELILMDMYMPECSGMELAAVIRQQPGYVGVPIVFLSSESDRGIQLDAMRIGGDDFLTKPIQSQELIQAVTIRAERYRTLRALMNRDSLTGLLNHTHIMASLDQEMARAERYGAPLSFAMLDIDHFKKVNDTYGHAAGDGVIKSLARMLQQRLRKTDIVGRYGGEEFAIIMPETDLASATRVMDNLRALFSEITHQVGDESFVVTFSCGVAAVPPAAKARVLQEGADKRLYLAKQRGRNRVVSSDF